MKEKIFFFVCTITFFLNIQYNVFQFATQDFFNDSNREISETLVTGRLLNAAQGSLMENGGFTGVYVSVYNDFVPYNRSKTSRDSHEKYLKNILEVKKKYYPYKTQIGGQALLYALFQKISPFSFTTNFIIFRSFNSFMLSFCLASFLFWAKRKFNFQTAILSFLFLLPNYWLFLYGKSTWWCNWVYFLPFVSALFFFEKNKTPNFLRYILMMGILFFIKFWFTGFEFITTFLIASVIPYLYYQYKNTTPFYILFAARHFVITLIPVLLTISFLLFQFYLETGDFHKGINHLADAFSRRTNSGYNYSENMKNLIHLKKYHLDILIRYAGNSFLSPEIIGIKIPFLIIFSVGFLSGLYLYLKNIDRKLVLATLFSFLAPISWLILFKQHAHIHTHIDFFVWYVPSLLLLIVMISLTLTHIFSKFEKK